MNLIPNEHDNPAEEIAERIKRDAETKANQQIGQKKLDSVFYEISESLDDIKTDL